MDDVWARNDQVVQHADGEAQRQQQCGRTIEGQREAQDVDHLQADMLGVISGARAALPSCVRSMPRPCLL